MMHEILGKNTCASAKLADWSKRQFLHSVTTFNLIVHNPSGIGPRSGVMLRSGKGRSRQS